MKLSMLSFNIAKNMDLATMVKNAREYGFAGVELRMQLGHGHGVDLDTDTAGRRAARDICDDHCVEICGLTLSNRFEYPEAEKRRESVDEVKQYIELAAELDANRVRVFGNDMPAGADRGEVLRYVGECLNELGEFGEDHNIEVNLEMHGQFNWWRYALRAVEFADHPNVGIVYNCDPRDVVGGSVSECLTNVAMHINHVHMHELSDPRYPYRQCLSILSDWGYEGYLSAEIGESAEPERLLGYYATLYRAYLGR